ncbi:hypothetical protein LCI18_002940 [Fusarium solani-melongenae]|uniref:Uncharacterized protein n=1 Tax=Fusarium solani subsp. cucurbitae TaxID=2747967 RepID=A0ACD3YSX7_FUSSC|nr:hypothetical protein LCI18_002940 [Fusarium solani-melongenae]
MASVSTPSCLSTPLVTAIAVLPSQEECLSHCLAAADGPSASTPASANSPSLQANPTTQRWDSHNSALAIEDPIPHGGHSQSCSPPDLLSDDAHAQEASASELNRISLAQGIEDLHFPASTVLNPGTFSPKRSLPERDASDGTEERDSEHEPSPERLKMTSTPSCLQECEPTRPSPEEASLQLPRLSVPRVTSSPAPTGSGISHVGVSSLLRMRPSSCAKAWPGDLIARAGNSAF